MSLVGSDILSLVTSGMYDNPLAIYREYVQNAADAFAAVGNPPNGRVEVGIDVSHLRVSIRDNGPGLTHEAAIRALLPIARSQKLRGSNRGFRGIGRLAGLAFAESVTFLTRATNVQPVTRIVWDGPRLRQRILDTAETEAAIRECVRVETVPGGDYPPHFFEVEVTGIGRHAQGSILNRELVRGYIGEVCPVPMSSDFPFASEIDNLFEMRSPPLLTLTIVLDDETEPITRRHGGSVRFSAERKGPFTRFEEVRVPCADGSGDAALGWIAHSSYLGAIPPDSGVRGIRARVGNIQIGDENVFEHLFPEERFNRWCVGEVHIMDPRIIPNGRRDYFEPGPHLRNLENRLSAVFRNIAYQCRRASTDRNAERKILSAICQLEETHELAESGYLASQDAKALVRQAVRRIPDLRENIGLLNGYSEGYLEKLAGVETKLVSFQARRGRPRFGGIPASEIAAYRKVFQVIAAVTQSPRTAMEMIEAVLLQT